MDVTISLAGNGGFILTVPSVLEGRSHNVEVPANEAGISVIRKVLRERQREARRELGNVSSPTQAQVEAWLAEDRRRRSLERQALADAAEQKKADEAKALIGDLDLGDLDL